MRFISYTFLFLLYAQLSFAQQDDVKTVRRIPALGVQITSKDEQELTAGLQEFAQAIDGLKLKQD